MTPIVDTPFYYPRLGRISLGYLKTDERGGRTRTYPQRTETFVFHSDSRERLEVVARVYGGKVEEATGAEEEGGALRVVSQTKSIECKLPSEDERGFDAWKEMWSAGGLVRRCNGETCSYAYDSETQRVRRDVPCICDELELRGDERCDYVTRLNIIVESLFDAPGIGVWQVQSRGQGTYRALAASVDLLKKVGRFAGVPLVLKVDMQKRRVEATDGKVSTQDVPVMSLDIAISMTQARQLAEAPTGDQPALPAPPPDRTLPPLGARDPVYAAPEHDVGTRVLTGELLELDTQLTALVAELQENAPLLVADMKAFSEKVTGKRTRRDYGVPEYQAMLAGLRYLKETANLNSAANVGRDMYDRLTGVASPTGDAGGPP